MSDNQLAVLWYCLMSKDIYLQLHANGLNEKWFTGEARLLYNKIAKYRSKYDVNEILIANLDLNNDEIKFINKVIEISSEYSLILWEQTFEALRKEYYQRELRSLTTEYTPEGLLKLSEQIASLARGSLKQEKTMKQIITEAVDEILKRQDDNYYAEFLTGIRNYDRLGYFERGSLVVIGGESGHGKTKYILNLIWRWLEKGHRIVLFSYEMSPKFVIMTIGMIKERIEWDKVFRKSGEKLSEDEKDRLIKTVMEMYNKPLLINTTAKTFEEMRLVVENFNADIMFIDTINNLIKTGERQDIALGEIARGAKRLAEKNDMLSVIVAQLKDLEQKQKTTINSRPTDKNLIKESREIRDAADYMDFIYREEEKKAGLVDDIWKDILEIYRVKGRYVGVGHTFLRFHKSTGLIEDLEDWEIETLKQKLRGG